MVGHRGWRVGLRKVAEWRGHDTTVCKLTMEVAAHAIALTGIAWGKDGCVVRVQWDQFRRACRERSVGSD